MFGCLVCIFMGNEWRRVHKQGLLYGTTLTCIGPTEKAIKLGENSAQNDE